MPWGEAVRQQEGYLFQRYGSWFVRFMDDIPQPDGSLKRKLVCKKLHDLPEGARRKDAERCAKEKFLDAVNRGALNPHSNMRVCEFVEKVYLPEYIEKQLRAATQKQYRDVWNNHIKPYMEMENLTLREFRTMHAKRVLDKGAESRLGRSSLRHVKAFLRGIFKQALGDGILDGINPVQNARMPRTAKPKLRHAYSLSEIMAMLTVLPDPAWTVVMTAAFSGLSKGELRGLQWGDFSEKKLTVNRVVWNSVTNDPKTETRQAPVVVVKQLADALEAHKLRAGKFAKPTLPIFQAGNGKPLNLDNLARRVIVPALSRCAVCRKREDEHKPEGHLFERDNSLPHWHGWHSFRRGLATNLHELGTDDKEIQAILRHSDVRLTQNIYIQSVDESQVDAMDALSRTYNELATKRQGRIQ